MSQENVEMVRVMVEAFKRRDSTGASEPFHADVEWDTTRIAGVVPDLAGIFRGAEGTRDLWRAWLSPWKDLVFDYELRDAGEHVVVLISNQRQWGRHSKVETEIPPYAWTYTIRDAEVVRGCFYPDHQSALEAAGLSE
jgi:ketosteroid isomerase-like protein